MPMSSGLKHFLAHLSAAERIPLPVTDEWTTHVRRISVPHRIAEVSEEHYWYWLEVLPPHYQSGSLFAFAEGREPLRLFWQEADGRRWCRQLTWDETRTFCTLAGIPLPS